MILKNDCIEIANKLIIELEMIREPIQSMAQIDSEFVWSLVKNVFKTDLLPEWNSLDCLDETEEFQFILIILDKIFNLNLREINPACLTIRKTQPIHFILNALYMANRFIKTSHKTEDSVHESKNSISSIDSIIQSFSDEESEISIDFSNNSNHNEDNVKKLDEINFEKISGTETSKKQIEKVKDQKFKELRELEEDKALIENLTSSKMRSVESIDFDLELSYRIVDVLKIEEKSKEIEKNLDRLKVFGSKLTEIPTAVGTKKKMTEKPNIIKNTKFKGIKNVNNRKKIFTKKNQLPKQFINKVAKLNLHDLLDQLTGLSIKQIESLKTGMQHQNEMINQIKINLMERKRNLNCNSLDKVDLENRILELLQQEMNLNFSDSIENTSKIDQQQLRKAKYELRKERNLLRKQLDEYHRHSLSDLKRLEGEQEKKLRELVKQREETYKEDQQILRQNTKDDQRKQFDSIAMNYESFYRSQSILIKEHLKRRKNQIDRDVIGTNDRNMLRHLDKMYTTKLYPKFD